MPGRTTTSSSRSTSVSYSPASERSNVEPRPCSRLIISVGNLQLDTNTREVTFGSSRPRLTATESAILEILMRRSPAVVLRRSIALAVWDEEADALGSNTIDVHLARLRGKIASSGARIETVRAVGYRIVAP